MTRYVGTDVRRPEGPAKVSGRALYVADVDVPGAWVGGAVRSDVARGRLIGLDLDPAFDFSRVVLVGPRDVPGDNVMALIADDQPVLAEREVRHFGEPLLLVAAPDRATLLAALAAIRPRIDEEVPVLDMELSRAVFKAIGITKGDVDAAFARPLAAGARVVEGVYRTGSQEQLYVEPQGCVAWPPDDDGTVRVEGSLQCPHYVRKALARALGIAPGSARVVQRETGGGFGGKEEYPSVVACHAALLARECGRPVKVIYERHEDLAVTPKRHPSRVRHRTLVGADGTLLAMDVDVLLDGGAYTTLSPVVLSRGCIHACGPYRCANVRVRGRVVATNHVPYGAFRGFGAPQTCFAIERQMDRIARELGIHPAELRRRNMLRAGDTTATGQVLRESVGSEPVMADILARTRFDEHAWCGVPVPGSGSTVPGSVLRDSISGSQVAGAHRESRGTVPGSVLPERLAERRRTERRRTEPGTVPPDSSGATANRASRVESGRTEPGTARRRGFGMSFFFHGAGFTGSGEEMLKGRVRVEIAPDGAVLVQAGSTEIGQGTNAMFLAIAADSLGTSIDDVRIETPDTGRVPDSGPTVASRTCMIVGGCVARACREIVARIGGEPTVAFRERALAFLARGGDPSASIAYESPPGLAWDEATYSGDAYPVYGWAADVAEVEVDMDTFEVEVKRVWTTVDVGKAIQPALVEGQIEGGTLQAVGFAHLEVVTAENGRFLQDRLATCVIPTTLDAPAMEVALVEVPYPGGPFGAKGVGELPMDGGAPAVCSAIEDATGIHVDEIPATPERLLERWLEMHPEAGP